MIQLKPKQIEGVQACLDRKSLILDYQAGSGKTFISAEVIKRLSKEGEKFIFATQAALIPQTIAQFKNCLLYTSPSPRDRSVSRMPSSA